ncbi:MAG: peptidoglycan DD-metalloendopeptidase family protein [Thermodesulfobacteriota bacterium]
MEFESRQKIVFKEKYRLKRKKLRRHFLGFVFCTLLLTFSIFFFNSSNATSKTQDDSFQMPASARAKVKLPTVTDVTIKRNDTLYEILRGFDVPHGDIIKIARLSKKVYNLKRLRKGDVLKVGILDDRLASLEFRYAQLEGLIIARDLKESTEFNVGRFEVPHEVRYKVASGVINDSLYQSALRAGADPIIILNLSDIFAWDVDFATDIRKGDEFRILYESVYAEGEFVRNGNIVAAEMINKGNKFSAISYEDSKGRHDFYDAKGKSLSRTLLKSPLRYRRISSRFSRRRYHPILKRYRPHHGIDYAAPRGTAVESSGDGKVVAAGWKSGYGKYVKIRHNSTYTTAYGHLSRISKGIRKGARITQGQVIGKVGSTGRATGPHLHYEVHIRGKMVNPLSVKSKSRRTLRGTELVSFVAKRSTLVAALYGRDGKGTVVASAAE